MQARDNDTYPLLATVSNFYHHFDIQTSMILWHMWSHLAIPPIQTNRCLCSKNHCINITILSRDLMRKTRSRGWWSHNTKSLSSTSHDLDTQRSCTKLFYFIFSLSNFIQDFLLILFFVNCFYLFFNLDLSIILCFISKLFLWLTKWVLRNKNLNSYPSLNHGTTDE
jgi:hypothetical protein